MVLLMTVEPGFGGQRFIDLCLPKIQRTRELLDDVSGSGGDIWLQVDGGVSAETIERCAEAGADTFVAGCAVYGSADPARACAQLRAQAESGHSPCDLRRCTTRRDRRPGACWLTYAGRPVRPCRSHPPRAW